MSAPGPTTAPAAAPLTISPQAWLVVIDPQRIFADPESAWAAPRFGEVVAPIHRLAERFAGRVIVTRWLPGSDRSGSWGPYFAAWPFADRPDDDPLFALVREAEGLPDHPTVDVTTFGKWGDELEAITGPYAELVLTGVSTDCCVIATALPAADAGCTVTVVGDACAGSTDENHTNALHAMGLFAPQITIATTEQVLAARG